MNHSTEANRAWKFTAAFDQGRHNQKTFLTEWREASTLNLITDLLARVCVDSHAIARRNIIENNFPDEKKSWNFQRIEKVCSMLQSKQSAWNRRSNNWTISLKLNNISSRRFGFNFSTIDKWQETFLCNDLKLQLSYAPMDKKRKKVKTCFKP